MTLERDGFVYFVGRHDDMIVSGGENINPAEIEEVLREQRPSRRPRWWVSPTRCGASA